MAGSMSLCRLLPLWMFITEMATALVLQSSINRVLPYRHYDRHRRNDDGRWYYRRRNRCSMAMAKEQGQEEIRQETETSREEKDDPSSLASCPFSKPFPRFRIDLTTKRKIKPKEGIWSLIPSIELPSLELPSPPWRGAMQKDQVERVVRQRQKKRTGNDGGDLEIVIQPSIDGISAFAFLWEESARLMGMREGSLSSSVVILGLPDASMAVVQNFCEIIQWMGTTMTESENDDNNNNNNNNSIILDAEFIKEENLDIPAVRLERISQSPDPIDNGSMAAAETETIINERTRLWVKRILVEQRICPFTRSDRMSGQGLVDLGVPVGSIAYHASFHKHPIGLFADTWRAIDQMIEAGPQGRSGVSSILLAAPEFDEDFDVWAGPIFAMLEAGVLAAGAEAQVGVVCFHPRYATPDGKSWPGFGQMHSVPRLEKWYRETSELSALESESSASASESSASASESSASASESHPSECPLTTEQIAAGGAWQRRTPHATINVLRADQLEVAESRRVSGEMYTENIDRLVGVNGIGNEKLARDLQREREQGASLL